MQTLRPRMVWDTCRRTLGKLRSQSTSRMMEESIAMQAQADLTKANAVEFNVRDEPWVKYKLEDGTLLFGRLVIPKIFKADEYDPRGQPIYAWSSQNLFTTICPRTLRGMPTNPPPTTIDPSTRTLPLSTSSVLAQRGGTF